MGVKIESFCLSLSVLIARVVSESSPSNKTLKEKLMAQGENDKENKQTKHFGLQEPLLYTESRYTHNCKMDYQYPIPTCIVTPQGAGQQSIYLKSD